MADFLAFAYRFNGHMDVIDPLRRKHCKLFQYVQLLSSHRFVTLQKSFSASSKQTSLTHIAIQQVYNSSLSQY